MFRCINIASLRSRRWIGVGAPQPGIDPVQRRVRDMRAAKQSLGTRREPIRWVWLLLAGVASVGDARSWAGGPWVPYVVEWVRQLGTPSADGSNSVAVDHAGNAFISGFTGGSLGGPNAGGAEAFLAKYSRAGNLLWTRQLGSGYSSSVAVDREGDVFISGATTGSLGGTNAGHWDAFLAKYSSAGELLWVRQLGSSSADVSHSVAVDASGNAFIAGITHGSLVGTSAGLIDAFLAKYSATGTLLWTRQWGTSRAEDCRSVATDSGGNAFITGTTEVQLNQGDWNPNALLVKYSSNGDVEWTRQLGTPALDYSFSVAVDRNDQVFIAGYTSGNLGGPNAGGMDTFLAKYTATGELLWTKQFGTSYFDQCYGVAVDHFGNAFLSGHTSGSLGGPHAGDEDAFLAKYSSAGVLLWKRQVGNSLANYCFAVAVDFAGSAFISGRTEGNLGGPSAGLEDAFLVKFSSVCPADIDNNGTVDSDDLAAVINAWGPCSNPRDCPADIDGNGAVNVNDLLAIINDWGPCGQ